LFFELEAHPDSAAAPVLIPTEPAIPSEPVRFFDVPFNVFVEGVGMVGHQAHFAINAGQPLLFANMVVGPPQSPAFHVTFDLVQTGGDVMTGSDLFTVTISGSVFLAGDYNSDNAVDAADYVMWRKLNGTSTAMANDPNPLPIDGDQYNTWRGNFGESAIGFGGGGAVPEPANLGLVVSIFAAAIAVVRSKRSESLLGTTLSV
jgi:hypothetical protein